MWAAHEKCGKKATLSTIAWMSSKKERIYYKIHLSSLDDTFDCLVNSASQCPDDDDASVSAPISHK